MSYSHPLMIRGECNTSLLRRLTTYSRDSRLLKTLKDLILTHFLSGAAVNNSGGQRSHNDTRVLGASRISKTNPDVSRIFSDGVTPTSNRSLPLNNNSRERGAGEGKQNEIMGRIMQL